MIVKIKDKEFSFDGYVQPLQSIQQLAEKAYQQGRADAIDEYRNKLSKEMHDLWRFYKADTNNRPKPTFLCANSMVDLIAEQLKEKE